MFPRGRFLVSHRRHKARIYKGFKGTGMQGNKRSFSCYCSIIYEGLFIC
nr:MAG TPA: hypothetical protein [Caudoviricetes sp.]